MLEGKLPGRETQARFLRFLLVGGTTALVQFALLAMFRKLMTPDAAFSSAFVGGTATHYGLNRFWALPSQRRDTVRQLIEYLLTAAASYLVNIGLFKACHDILGLGVMRSAVVAVPPATILVFVLLNFHVFRITAHPKQQ